MTDNLTSSDIKTLLSDPTAENRAEAAKKVSEQFNSGELSDSERKIAEDIFKIMVRDAEERVRLALSDSLKDNPDVPHDVAVSLANDVVGVAAPMLEFSDVLTDEDLKEIITSQGAETQIAIARRENLSADVADTIVENSDNEDVIFTLVSNEGADLQEDTMGKVMDKYGDVEAVSDSLANRGQLPINVAERLVSLVSEKVRDHLVTHHEMTPDMVMDLFLSARERATVSLLGDGADVMDVRRLVEQLHEHGRLTGTLIFRAICMGDVVFFEAALAKLCNIPVSSAYKLIHDRGDMGLTAIYRECNLSPQMLPIVKAALDVAKDMETSAGEDRDRFQQRMLERMLTNCEDDFDPENLDYFITKLGSSKGDDQAA
ncbi:hypothetical protein MNBD_ALPHA01-386 [hydrothermal vent metagenome]|uniref:DUF2336 domain-containing protein n=1 Tax=hydrothermal vent metagenome TaxID=652676 RepID=A0A3B0SIT2_9ZZZZ